MCVCVCVCVCARARARARVCVCFMIKAYVFNIGICMVYDIQRIGFCYMFLLHRFFVKL